MASANKKVTNIWIGRMTGTERTLYATWDFDEKHVDHYEYQWFYGTGDGIGFEGPTGNANVKNCTYTIAENVRRVHIKVLPVAKKKEDDKKQVPYWTGEWVRSQTVLIELGEEDVKVPKLPKAPTVTLEDFNMTVELMTDDPNADGVVFRLIMDDQTEYQRSPSIPFTKFGNTAKMASFVFVVQQGHKYRAQATCYNNKSKKWSGWGDLTGNEKTIPGAIPSYSLTASATSSTSVLVNWSAVNDAKTYTVEYTTNSDYFDTSSLVNSQTVSTNAANITGLASGQMYYFRVKASNDVGDTGWVGPVAVIIGKPPTAPTTWSNVSTAIVGDRLILYWTHNTTDGSKQQDAQIQLTINGSTQTIKPTFEIFSDEEQETIYYHEINTSGYPLGATITWRVRTKGIYDSFSPWSILRTIKIYAPPTLSFSLPTMEDGVDHYIMKQFPLVMEFSSGPSSQTPIGYQVTIRALTQYRQINSTGIIQRVNVGDVLYSEYFADFGHTGRIELSPNVMSLQNTEKYEITMTVTMDSGLTADNTEIFELSYSDLEEWDIEVNVGYNTDTASALIQPFCFYPGTDDPYPNLRLAVYRREYNGDLTKIIDNVKNESKASVLDAHPALDYARYRILITNQITGKIDAYDPPDIYGGIKDVILQWDEMIEGLALDPDEEDLIDPMWVGGMLRLPYNIDVTDNFSPDVEVVDYIGRKYGVSYYGTKTNHESQWDVMIDKADEDTIYKIRKIGAYNGNVYVREPSGTGYWATIRLNMSQKHNEPGSPVSITITRVEGGQ